jgi:hypothetical protein
MKKLLNYFDNRYKTRSVKTVISEFLDNHQ